MEIFLNILFFILGMIFLIKGADFFVMGASSVAKKFKIPSLFIGLTIVALGTSLPELSVSITSAIRGSMDMSVSNIVGSNLFNMLFILGTIAIFSSVKMENSTKKIDLPFLLAVTATLMLFSVDAIFNGATENIISRTEAIVFITLLSLYMYILIANAKRKRNRQLIQDNYFQDKQQPPKENEKILKVWQIILCLILGLAAVIFGGETVSKTAQFLAIKMGMSEALVGLTIVAVGTSLPELVTSIVATKKQENDLALGNIIGSNIMNITLIIGLVALIGQISISSLIIIDLLILLVSTIFLSILCFTRENINKKQGFVLVTIYILYIAFSIIRNYCF